MHTHRHTPTHTHKHIHTHTHTPTYTYAYTHVHTHLHTHTHIRTHAYIHIRIHAYSRTEKSYYVICKSYLFYYVVYLSIHIIFRIINTLQHYMLLPYGNFVVKYIFLFIPSFESMHSNRGTSKLY